MPASTDATPRRKRTSPPPAASPRRASRTTGKKAASGKPGRRRWWPISMAASVIFLLAYVLDPDAVGHLLWAGMGGRLGQRVRIACCIVLILVGTVLAWAWSRPATEASGKTPPNVPRPAAATAEKKRRRTVRPATPPQDDRSPPDPGNKVPGDASGT
jgi:hypothetical protein